MGGTLSNFLFQPFNAARGWFGRRARHVRGIAPLPGDVAADMERGRAWVRGCFQAEPQPQFETVAGRLAMIQLLLSSGGIKPDEQMKQECLGIIFGDALAQHTGLTWVMRTDAWFGDEPALNLAGTSLCIFPLSMIAKRITNGEAFRIGELFAAICEEVNRLSRLPDLV